MCKHIVNVLILICLVRLAVSNTSTLSCDDYVTIRDGHLWKNGQRQRYWATNLLFVGDKYHPDRYSTNYESIDAGIERLKKTGYNAIRYWVRGWGKDFEHYQKGDRSQIDYSDYFLSRLKQEGFVVWTAGFNFDAARPASPDDVNIVVDSETAAEWAAAVEADSLPINKGLMRGWDVRFRRLYIDHIKRYLNHYNQYTEMYAYEDPLFAVWEITNEEWWVSSMLAGNWKAAPEYFRRELVRQWNQWLKDKYGSTEELAKVWTSLLPGESLEAGNLAFAPMAIDSVDVQIATLGAGNLEQLTKGHLSRDNLPKARGADVIEFIVGLFVNYKKEVSDAIRSHGKSGRGCQIVPIIWDTGMRNDLPTAYAISQSETACSGIYMRGITSEKQDTRFPWLSGLSESPRLYFNSPWLEQNRIEGKPTFIYEVNTWNPSKYRAEFPLRLAALASIQDWDWVSLYQLDGFRRIDADPAPYNQPMRYENDAHHWDGTYYIFDEVFQAAVKSGGEMFRSFAVKPAPNPTVIHFSKDAVFNLEAQNYRWRPEGLNLILADILGPTTYRYGLRINFRFTEPPQHLPVLIDGPYVLGRAFQHTVVKPNDEITYDWRKEYLQLDSASAKSVVGFLPEHWAFSDEVEIRDIEVVHPEGQVYVLPGERYAQISLVAKDGKKLSESGALSLTASSTSFNEGFHVKAELVPPMSVDKPFGGLLWGETYARLFSKTGSGVTVSRVKCKVFSSALTGKTYKAYDFNLKLLNEGVLDSGIFELDGETPVFFVEFTK